MPFSGYPLSTSFTNASPQTTDHPAHHNAVAAAANDLQTQIDTLSTSVAALGIVAYAEVTANQGSITTIVDLTGLSVTFTAVTGRTYLVTAQSKVSTTVAADIARLTIADGASTALQNFTNHLPITGGISLGGTYRTAALTGSTTLKLRMERATGTGTLTHQAAAANPAFILVEDLGVI